MTHPFAPPQGATRPAARSRPAAAPWLLGAALLALAAVTAAASVRAAPTDKYGGTYRIQDWRALEARNIHHFFYLQPDGRFLLAAEWPGNERSLFVGTWSVADDRLYLVGSGSVDTNQGAWRTDFQRTFRIQVEDEGFVLRPEPVKNRYGLLGWPQAFRFHRRQPTPNLPGRALPADAEAMARQIADLLAQQP